jgi:hypothetical protein
LIGKGEKHMSQKQYLKMLEREIHRINQKIDMKIIAGENYAREARNHKLLIKKVRYHSKPSVLRRFFPTFSGAF